MGENENEARINLDKEIDSIINCLNEIKEENDISKDKVIYNHNSESGMNLIKSKKTEVKIKRGIMREFGNAKEFIDFINEFDGEIKVVGDKAYLDGFLIAEITKSR